MGTLLAQAEGLRFNIKKLKADLEAAKRKLDRVERDCGHEGNWGKEEYTPEHRSGYTIPGDAPGTMGVDRRGPTHVPAETIKRWERKCSQCGKVQVTDSVNKATEVKETPRWPTR